MKAAIGANKDLNKIFVFDPCLFEEGEQGEALKIRYAKCFSEKWQNRIVYLPDHHDKMPQPGTFKHFTDLLTESRDSLLFGLEPEKSFQNPIF